MDVLIFDTKISSDQLDFYLKLNLTSQLTKKFLEKSILKELVD